MIFDLPSNICLTQWTNSIPLAELMLIFNVKMNRHFDVFEL